MSEKEAWLKQVLQITYDLFPGVAEIELQYDPDVANQAYIVFVVGFCGGVEEQIQRQLSWHKRVEMIADSEISDMRLLIIPRTKYIGK